MSKLAIHGGTPVFPEGPPAWPFPDPDVRSALLEMAEDGSWGRYHGAHGARLAEALAAFHGVEFVWLCCSGTFAVELALRALQVGPGDEVVLAGYDFSGNFRAIESVGAVPVLVDVDPDSWRLSQAALGMACTEHTRAILVSHLHGMLADMAELRVFADARNLVLVEDACQVPGARVRGRRAGTWGDVGVLSFGGSKLLSAGRGGALLTRHPGAYQRAKVYCERGNDAYPLSELQAAVLRPQLQQLEVANDRRREHARRLIAACQGLPGLRFPELRLSDSHPAYYKIGMLHVPDEQSGMTREAFIAALQAEGVACDAGFRGFVQRSPKRCRRVGDLVHSARAAAHTIVLHHPILATDETTIGRLARALTKVTDAFGQGSQS